MTVTLVVNDRARSKHSQASLTPRLPFASDILSAFLKDVAIIIVVSTAKSTARARVCLYVGKLCALGL